MFSIPKNSNPTELIAWWLVTVDRRKGGVLIQYAAFLDVEHLSDSSREPLRPVATIVITGATAQPLLATADNHLYSDTRSLIGRLLTGQATAQEQADVAGWQALGSALSIDGVEHLDSDPFDLGGA